MSIAAPELSPGSNFEGYTVGALVRTRVGAATYAATDSSGQAVHLTVYAPECFPSALVRERAVRELFRRAVASGVTRPSDLPLFVS